MAAQTGTLTNAQLLDELRSSLRELERRVENYREADADPETGDVAADEGLVLAARAEWLLGETCDALHRHRRHFVQLRPDDEEAEADG